MKVHPEEQNVFEVCLVVPKRKAKKEDATCDCVEVLENAFLKVGFMIERIDGVTDEFMKLAAPLKLLGKAAARLEMKKRTHIGMDLLFELDEVDAFVRQPDGSLFSWCERFRCYHHLIYGIVNENQSAVTLKCDEEEFQWKVGESLVRTLESKKIVKQIFPLHDEIRRKKLLGNWALNWWDFTGQPIDEVYSYFGPKIALYFAFLGMYTRWMLFPAALGLILQLVEFGSMRLLVLPIFFISIILWAIMFSQFWRRKNSALIARWQINYTFGGDPACRLSGVDSSLQIPVELIEDQEMDKRKEKEAFQRIEWFGRLRRFRNDAIVILSIICLQLPFELAYAHCYEVIQSDAIKFGLTVLYLFAIQYFTRLGAKMSMKLINCENYENNEKRADSLVYKIFGLYFMQSYIGVFYHALLHRNFATLRQVLIQRLLISEVLENLLENSLPYLKYSYRKYKVRSKKRREKGSSQGKIQFTSRAEKEYLKPSYSASIGVELEDGLFDDCLELALQFGMIMMFACAFPLAFAFAALNNITEIRTDALKLLAMYKRPFPRAATTIGAWLNIFQKCRALEVVLGSTLFKLKNTLKISQKTQ
ncbi:anoctamin-like protein At1g73020 isoform X2 [Cucumis sativus]|uniref:anoctamin-like protein At1g73020 isoform X2 n=1 Tax=Cucumis sativus TaxID=3659 RepID=UPI0012F49BAC|nr:anoctamin-like protein At1g73020 isoform X2 [Cucumis sativus]